jgi:hypothetical protein
MLPCSPLEVAPEPGPYTLFDTTSLHLPPRQSRNRFENLSINTSFLDDWTRSSSPMSISSMPATPESYVAGPSPLEATSADPFATAAFHFDAFDQHALHKSFDLQPQLHLFADDGACAVNTPYVSHDFVAPIPNTTTTTTTTTAIKDHNGYVPYEHHLGKSEIGHAHLGLDFTLVATLPPYTI